MTTAALGFKIDSSQAPAAAVDLEKLYAAAVKIEGAVDNLEASARGLNTALSQTGQGAQKVAQPVEQVGRAMQQQDQHVQAFRSELERLTAKFQPLSQAQRNYEASVGEINRAHQLGVINAQQMQKALDAERMAYDRLKMSADAAGRSVQAANQNNATGAQRAAGVNAGYQFQDIAVTAFGGMSPLMIGLQQGTQLASVVSSMERPVAGLVGAFTSLINPVSLVTIGLTAGVAALIQYFTAADEGAEEFEQKFAKQAELIQNVAARWGDAYPALKAYSDQLQATADQADLVAGQNAAVELRYKQMGEALDGLVKIAPEVSRSLRDITSPEGAQAAIAYEKAISDMRAALEAGKDPSEAFGRATQALGTIINESGSESLRKYGDQFDVLANKMGEATRQAEAFRMQLPDLGTLQGPWSEGGQLFFPEQFMPTNPGVPTRRPLIELEGLPGAGNETPTVINSDGRMVNVPIPSQRPNYFEREAGLPNSFSGFRANRNTYWSREVLDEESRRKEMGGMFKGFFTDFGDALRNNSGDLGKALMEGLSSAAMNAASQAWEKFANLGANMLVNAILGQPSAGLMNKGIGFSGANTTIGQILGAGGGVSANDNAAGGFSGLGAVGAVTRAPLGDIAASTDVAAYIRDAAVKRGIDPNTALAVAKSEGGLNSWNLQSNYVKNGVREASYGPFQLYKGGGLGNEFMAKTGLDPALAANGPAGVDFALDHAAKNGWGAWYGAKNTGIGNWQGIGVGGTGTAAEAVDKLASSAGAATKGLDTFGGGLGKVGESLSTNFFPSAPAAPGGGGGGGGLFGWLGNLFSPDLSAYKGKIGMFADGTNYAPGGMAIVGERGPELVNLPQGSQVFSNHKSMDMMRDGGRSSGGNQRPQLIVNVHGGSGDDHIRQLSRQGAEEAIYQYNDRQVNGGFGDNQKQYNARVG